jgi:hypothetical protein
MKRLKVRIEQMTSQMRFRMEELRLQIKKMASREQTEKRQGMSAEEGKFTSLP